jgi:hypothetical protein
MMDIYVYQGSGNIIQLIRACRSKGKINQLFKITYLWWRYETGTKSCPLSTPAARLRLDYTNSKWINAIYQFTTTYDIQIYTNIESPSILPENDKFIMDLAQEQGFSLKILRCINQCWLYLHVLTLTDITNEIGTMIEPQFYIWKEASSGKSTFLATTSFPKPSKSTWTYWKQLIDKYVIPNSRRLKSRLGGWTAVPSQFRKKYKYYYHEDLTYQMKNGKLHQIHPTPSSSVEPIDIPDTAVPAIYTLTNQTLYTDRMVIEANKNEETTNDVPQPQNRQWKQFNGQLPPEVIIATDALVHQEKAAYAWIIATTKGKVIVSHSARIEAEDISSYQAEAHGILDAISTLQNHVFEVQQWILYCDNQALVERLQIIQSEQETPPEWTNSDIIELIRQKVLPNGEFKHVKGHQKISNNSNHPIESVLNNWVDDMANKAIKFNNKTTTPENIARVVINNKRIFTRTQIIAQCAEKASRAYHNSKYGDKAYHQIDWDFYKKIVSKFTKSMSIIKMIHSLTPTNERLHHQYKDIVVRCSLCKEEDETIHHVLCCKANPKNFRATNEWRKERRDITTSQYQTIVTLLSKILDTKPPNEQNLPMHQIQIGWQRILQVKITKSCVGWMNNHLKDSLPSIPLEKFMITLLKDWSEAWKYRNQQVNHDSYTQQSNCNIIQQKLQYIYENREYIDKTNQTFMLQTIEEHQMLMDSSVENWLHIHFETFTNQIVTTKPNNTWMKFKQNLDKLQTHTRNQIRWTDIVPCEAPKALNESFEIDST